MTASGSELEAILRGAEVLSVPLEARQAEALLAYLDLLYHWNRTANLTAVGRRDAVRLHLLDSLAPAPLLRDGPVADLGSGAGLPGLALAIAIPEQEFLLSEVNRRRCNFLREAKRELALANLEIVEGDADAMAGRHTFGTVVSRAFRKPRAFLDIAARLLPPGGTAILMLAEACDTEIARLARIGSGQWGLVETRRLALPGGVEPRANVGLRRLG